MPNNILICMGAKYVPFPGTYISIKINWVELKPGIDCILSCRACLSRKSRSANEPNEVFNVIQLQRETMAMPSSP